MFFFAGGCYFRGRSLTPHPVLLVACTDTRAPLENAPELGVVGLRGRRASRQATEVRRVLDYLATGGAEAFLGGVVTRSHSTVENSPVVGERKWFKFRDSGDGLRCYPVRSPSRSSRSPRAHRGPHAEFPDFIPGF